MQIHAKQELVMQTLSWSSIGFYCVFAVFTYYQGLHAKGFRGASQGFLTLLNISGLAGMLTGIIYLGYYGWTVAWWAPIVAFTAGVFAIFPGVVLERLVGATTLSIAAFLVWPLAAYYMFTLLPK
jgi:hypothetical protein